MDLKFTLSVFRPQLLPMSQLTSNLNVFKIELPAKPIATTKRDGSLRRDAQYK
jgi:hypothetical protein